MTKYNFYDNRGDEQGGSKAGHHPVLNAVDEVQMMMMMGWMKNDKRAACSMFMI